jgi:hypothetical protein
MLTETIGYLSVIYYFVSLKRLTPKPRIYLKLQKMVYTEAEKLEILSLYIKNNKNKKAARREYIRIYPNHLAPSENTFLNVFRHLRDTHSLSRKRRNIIVNENENLDILLYFEGNFLNY